MSQNINPTFLTFRKVNRKLRDYSSNWDHTRISTEYTSSILYNSIYNNETWKVVDVTVTYNWLTKNECIYIFLSLGPWAITIRRVHFWFDIVSLLQKGYIVEKNIKKNVARLNFKVQEPGLFMFIKLVY